MENITFFFNFLTKIITKLDLGTSYKKSTTRNIKTKIKLLKYYRKTKNERMVSFLEDCLAELVFFEESGIRTNVESIIKYRNFKRKLGENYKWVDIRIIREYLVFYGEEVKIKVNKSTFRRASIGFFVLIILIIGLVYAIAEYIIPTLKLDIKSTILVLFILGFFIVIRVFILKVTLPPIYANGIKKKLEKKEEMDNKSTHTSKQ